MDDDLAFLDATAQAELVRTGTVSAAELVDAAIERIEALNPILNAVIHPRFERARADVAAGARSGPFAGVPMVLKDIGAMAAGEAYHAGLKAARASGFMAATDSTVVERLRAAGLVDVGRSNTPELALLPTTEPESYGPTRNPWDTGRSTGGSSGGSAAAVASGMVPIGHANDLGGSIRVPAASCGIVGLKPSRGRVPHWPEAAEGTGGLNAEFAVTRSVRDAATLLDAIAGFAPGDVHTPPTPADGFAAALHAGTALRVGLLTRAPDGQTPVHPECAAAAEDAARVLEGCGHIVELTSPPALESTSMTDSFVPVYAANTAHQLDLWAARLGRALQPDDMEAATWMIAEMGRAVTASEYIGALAGLHRFSHAVQSWWSGGFDLLVTPTLSEPAPLLGSYASSPDNPLNPLLRATATVAFVAPFNVTGQPAMSLPSAWSASGLPLGVQLIGAYGKEDVVLQAAVQLEQARPWADRRPAVSA